MTYTLQHSQGLHSTSAASILAAPYAQGPGCSLEYMEWTGLDRTRLSLMETVLITQLLQTTDITHDVKAMMSH